MIQDPGSIFYPNLHKIARSDRIGVTMKNSIDPYVTTCFVKAEIKLCFAIWQVRLSFSLSLEFWLSL